MNENKMEFIMSMVHHNPGEAPFDTQFNDPQKLVDYGYNSQVFKHLNTVIRFDEISDKIFEEGTKERIWIDNFALNISNDIFNAKQKGLKVYFHIDLFVLPKKLVELYKDEICDENGKISLNKDMTLNIHKIMFDEMFKRFPEVDGLIIRVGETYLHDTPYHTGNGAIKYGDKNEEKQMFIKLINFLKDEVCVKHDRYLFFRTWDCFSDRFHTNLEYYLDITNNIQPNPKLIFSIKHTAIDFWRKARFNDCIAKGKHRQVIEVQCQREYEGKGAYPSYVMDGVINSFPEYDPPAGFKYVVDNPLICGVYAWPRGGGWYGPYIKNEFWPDLNAYVIAQYCNNTNSTEEDIFFNYTKNIMHLSDEDSKTFRKLCKVSSEALLKGRYISPYDKRLDGRTVPCNLWMRDDRLGGFNQLSSIFEILYDEHSFEQALNEKRESIDLWYKVKNLYNTINWNNNELGDFIGVGIDYAILLFKIVFCAWDVMIEGFISEKQGKYNIETLKEKLLHYDEAWTHYKELENNPYCSSLYKSVHLFDDGLEETIRKFRKIIKQN